MENCPIAGLQRLLCSWPTSHLYCENGELPDCGIATIFIVVL